MKRSEVKRVSSLACLLLALAAISLLAGSALAYWPSNPPTLPAKGGKFVDPTWGTTIMRVTDATDGGDWGTVYSYWPAFNKDNSRLLVYDITNNVQYVQHFDPVNFLLVGNWSPLFPTSPPGGGSPRQDDAIWSGVTPTLIYAHDALKIWSYDVDSGVWTLIKDFTGAGLAGDPTSLWQMHRSMDDNVFSFTSRRSGYVGYAAWKRDTNEIKVNVADTTFDEVQVDKSGRYLLAKLANDIDKVYDMQTGTVETLTDGAPDYAPGHSDNETNVNIGYENWENRVLKRSFATPHSFSLVLDWGNNWSLDQHISCLGNDETKVAMSSYAMNTPPDNYLRDEVFLITVDGNQTVTHVCHHYSHYTDYYSSPRGNVSRDHKYFAYTSNYANQGRLDLFIVQIPDGTPQPPVANFSGNPTSGTAPLTVSFTDTSTNSPTSWSWTFGDGGNSTSQNPSHQYTSAGTYTVSLTATNAYGSDGETKTNYITVTSGGGPTTIFSDDFEASFSGWTTTGSPDWYTGTPRNGTHSIRLRGSSASGYDEAIERTVSTAGYQDITVTFYMGAYSLDNANEYVEAVWYDGSDWAQMHRINNGDPEEDNQLHAMQFNCPAGANNNPSFAIKFGIVASGGQDYGYVDDVVVQGTPGGGPQPPVANFTGSPTSGTAPLTVNFTDTSTNSPTSWSWTFGDGGNSTSQNPSHQYTSAGTYTVSLTATNSAGSDGETKTNYITVTVPPPVANFTGNPTSGTAPLTVNFTDTSTNSPTSWSWNFGDSSTSTSQNPSHQYASAGTYTVSLRATNAGGYDDEVKSNYISVSAAGNPPVANFTGSPTSGTAPLTVNFTDTSTNSPTSWSWTFGDGGNSTSQNPSHQYTSAGTYTVSLTATNAYGSDGETKTNYITVTSGGGPTTIFSDDFEASFSGWTQTGTPDWHTGTPRNGTHSIRLRGSSASGYDEAIERTVSTAGYQDIVVTFYMGAYSLDNANEYVEAVWYDGSDWAIMDRIDDGDPEEDNQLHAMQFNCPAGANNNPSFAIKFGIVASGTGDYGYVDDVVVAGTPGGGPQPPVADFTASPTSGAAPLTVSFTDTSTNSPTSWSWTFGDGGTSTSQDPSHQYTSAGDHTVSLTATNAGGSDSETKTNYISVCAANEAFAYPDTWEANWYTPGVTLQSGSLADLRTDNGEYLVIRSDPDAQTYGVIYEADTAYAPSQLSKITVEYQANVSRSDTPASGVVFVRKSDGTYEDVGGWLMGTTDTDWSWNSTAVSTYMSSAGVVGFEWCGCPTGGNTNNYDVSSDKLRFRLELAGVQPPVADFSGSPTSGTAPLTVNFTDTSTNSPTSWSWNFGDGGTSTSQNPSHQYTSAGSYTVSLRATNAGGYDDEVKSNYISVSGPTEVYVYPYQWTTWAGVSLLSGTLADLETDNNVYMVYQCNTSNQQFEVEYNWDTTYAPADLSKITVELQWKDSRSDTPAYGLLLWDYISSTWYDLRTRAPGWPTTDTWFTWETTDVSRYMSAAGEMTLTYCGCPENSNNYDTSIDVTRMKFTLN